MCGAGGEERGYEGRMGEEGVGCGVRLGMGRAGCYVVDEGSGGGAEKRGLRETRGWMRGEWVWC